MGYIQIMYVCVSRERHLDRCKTLHDAHMHCQTTTTVEVLGGNQEAAEGGQVPGESTAVKRTAAAAAELVYHAVGTHPQGLWLVVEHPKAVLIGAEG